MSILFCERTRTFHLFNNEISYIMTVLPNEQMGQLYFGKRIHHKEDFSYLLETGYRPMTSYVFEGDRSFSLEHVRQEYGVYGTTDYRHPAVEILQENGSRLSDFRYQSHTITAGKPKLVGLPATYTEEDGEAETLYDFRGRRNPGAERKADQSWKKRCTSADCHEPVHGSAGLRLRMAPVLRRMGSGAPFKGTKAGTGHPGGGQQKRTFLP